MTTDAFNGTLRIRMAHYRGLATFFARSYHAASIALTGDLCGIDGARLVPPAMGAQEVSVPIWRGSPPDLIR
jgi:hypothetical protein